MFKKADETRAKLLQVALALFRTKGFDATTMRDIAAGSELSIGAAYYYFPSKEAIILAYYEDVQAEHRRRVEAALPSSADLRQRLGMVMHSKLDLVKEDRNLLGALMRYVGEPGSPVSILGRRTQTIRDDSRALVAEAIGDRVPAEIADLVVTSVWSLQMGFLMYFIYDFSEGAARTRRLIDSALDWVVQILPAVSNPLVQPLARPLLKGLTTLMSDAGLLPAGPAARVA